MSKVERLLNLTALLLNTERPLTVERIGDLIEGYPEDPASFRRTFERDKDDLREMGIPISVLPIDKLDASEVGYRVLPSDYYAPEIDLAPDELAALRLAVTAIRLEGTDTARALRTLGASPESPAEHTLAALDMPEGLPTAFAALTERRVLRFRYNESDREVEPGRLEHQRGRWYLTGFDRSRGEIRSFRLDRITGSLASGDPHAFDPPKALAPTKLDPWQFGDDEPVLAVIRVDADSLELATATIGTNLTWSLNADGSSQFSVEVSNQLAFMNRLVDVMEHVEVLSPPELRQAWTTRVTEAMRHFNASEFIPPASTAQVGNH